MMAMRTSLIALGSLLFAGLLQAGQANQPATPVDTSPTSAVAVFAGGCFWCTESDFDKVPGVLSTTSGYIGGHVKNPTYEDVSYGASGHIEAVQVRYDSSKTSYAQLLEAFWPTIDPVTKNAQFCDKGSQYRSAIFYADAQEQQLAESSKAALDSSGKLPEPVVTEILPATTFYPAEEYHQDYYTKNPIRYAYYRNGCGRDARLEQLWGKKAD
jgi:peptide-methionine (S)-S-oxide reductase